MAPTFTALRGDYARLWDDATITRVSAADRVARRIIKDRARYEEVEAATGVPWAFVAVLHDRERSGDFRGVLHNGQRIIGTGKKTTLVPKGRGPFKTWLEAAVDALTLKGLEKITDWSVERCLYEGERFNGWGYRNKGVPSAYLWAGTSVYRGGKYVADHVWDPSAQDAQLGIAPVMVRLMALDPSVSFDRRARAPAGGPAVPSGTEAREIQERLRALGYAEAGVPNGEWGTRSIAALTAFQVQEGLPRSDGIPDMATLDKLFDVRTASRPVSKEREDATVASLRPTSPTLQATLNSKVGAAVLGAGGLAAGVVQGVASMFSTAADMLNPVREYFDSVPGEVWALGVAGLAFLIWRSTRRAEEAKVAAFRDGTDAGPA